MQINRFPNFIGQGVDEDGAFLKKMRRTQSVEELLSVCDEFLLDDQLLAGELFDGVIARPNCEV